MKDDLLDERKRAEDILLGSLGFGEEAKIVRVQRQESGFQGTGVWADGEEFSFENEDELEDLEIWALGVLVGDR